MDFEPTPDTYVFDLPSWRDGYWRGHFEGNEEGWDGATHQVRDDLWHGLSALAEDVGLGLRHDCETPLAAIHTAMEVVALERGERPRERKTYER